MKLLPWLIIIMAMMALVMFAADQVNQSAAERSYARAAVIRAQGQARLDATAAFLPYVIVAVSVAFGSSLIAIGLVILSRPGIAPQPQRLIERQVIIVIAPSDQPRRQVWRQVSERAIIK